MFSNIDTWHLKDIPNLFLLMSLPEFYPTVSKNVSDVNDSMNLHCVNSMT